MGVLGEEAEKTTRNRFGDGTEELDQRDERRDPEGKFR